MKKAVLLLLTLVATFSAAAQERYIDKVNPFVDTHKSRWFFFDSASLPFGMVSLSPDTATADSWNSGYMYDSLHVRCFSHVHNWQMSGVPVLPTTGEFKGHMGMDAYRSAFTHDGEIAKPGYHKIHLDDYGITAELTATTRVGFHKYTYPESADSYILFDLGAYLAHGGRNRRHRRQPRTGRPRCGGRRIHRKWRMRRRPAPPQRGWKDGTIACGDSFKLVVGIIYVH